MNVPDDEFSIYIHIPFCTRKCPYCHFYVTSDKDPLKKMLLDALQKEWAAKKQLCEKRTLTSIYFGGGTPILFGPERVSSVIQMLRDTFFIGSDCEITIEANPENSTLDTMQAYKQAGINRVSIGIQSLQENELQILGRKHSASLAEQAVHDTFKAGIENISIDLMYETPTQTLASWKDTLERAVTLPISHISLYNLTFEPGTAFWKKAHLLQKLVPNHEIGLQMYHTAQDVFQQHGFSQYEISAFAKNGNIAKHNIGYWTAREFLGLGPSAFSFFQKKRFQNVCSLTRYSHALDNQTSPIDFEEAYDDDTLRRELFTIGLRPLRGIHLPTFQSRFGTLQDETLSTLQKLKSLDLVSISDQVQLTEKGLLFYDTVASELI